MLLVQPERPALCGLKVEEARQQAQGELEQLLQQARQDKWQQARVQQFRQLFETI